MIESKMERVETQVGKALWRCVECGYIAKKNHMKEHIEAKECHNDITDYFSGILRMFSYFF